jgi:hypothetical protein
MTVAPVGQPNSRYSMELRRVSDNSYLGTVPFKDLQAEWKLGNSGANLRCSIPYRGEYDWITPDLLWPGKTELWLRDNMVTIEPGGVPTTSPDASVIFAGPILDVTASSSDGTLSVAAANYLFYLKKRILRNNIFWSSISSGRETMSNVMYYLNGGAVPQPLWNFKIRPAGPDRTFDMFQLYPTNSWDLRYATTDMINALDLLDDLTQVSDFEYYMFLDRLVMSKAKGFTDDKPRRTFTYGAPRADFAISNYSFSVQAENTANLYYTVSGPYIHSQIDNAAMGEYGTMYQEADMSGTAVTPEANQALADNMIKTTARAMRTPQLVFRSDELTPFRTFYYGQVMRVEIEDGWVQYAGELRVTGWQLTITGTGNATTTVYTNDLSGVA